MYGATVLVAVLFFAQALALGSVADDNSTAPLSLDAAVKMGMDSYLEMISLNLTGSSYYLGCCPGIVPPGRKGSVVQGYSAYRANVAIIVDWSSRRHHWMHPCTTEDRGFYGFIDWGDGTYDYVPQKVLGPFQRIHQYPAYTSCYPVTVYYCSAPRYGYKCCDVLYQTIIVTDKFQ